MLLGRFVWVCFRIFFLSNLVFLIFLRVNTVEILILGGPLLLVLVNINIDALIRHLLNGLRRQLLALVVVPHDGVVPVRERPIRIHVELPVRLGHLEVVAHGRQHELAAGG